jgi:hypothetical protein
MMIQGLRPAGNPFERWESYFNGSEINSGKTVGNNDVQKHLVGPTDFTRAN